jgi:hypothetical protein
MVITFDQLKPGLAIRENCFTYDGILYERLYGCEYRFRYFVSVDDYDYIDDLDYERILLTRDEY